MTRCRWPVKGFHQTSAVAAVRSGQGFALTSLTRLKTPYLPDVAAYCGLTDSGLCVRCMLIVSDIVKWVSHLELVTGAG